MSALAYPVYQDSRVEWLGAVPAHWSVLAIKRLSPVLRGASPRPIDDLRYFDDEGEYAWVRIADVSACDGKLTETPQRLSELGSSLSVKLQPGDLFISIAGSVGKPCISSKRGKTPAYLKRIRVDPLSMHKTMPDFRERHFLIKLLLHLRARGFAPLTISTIKACIHDGFVYFPQLKINLQFFFRIFEGGLCYAGLGKFGTQLNLNTDTIGSIKIGLPPPIEQSAIATFLDRETGKIDTLVAEQERLMALLKEKRQAVISHAVTKGLDPNAKMKPSGVECLHDVPADWRVMPLRHLAHIGNGSTPNRENPAYWQDGAFPWLNSSNVNREVIDDSSEFVTELALKECHLPIIQPPAVLIGITGQGRTRGMASLLEFEATVNQHVAFVKPDEGDLSPYFLKKILEYLYEYMRLESDGGGSTKGAITCAQIAELRVPVPSIKEQRAIVSFLEVELTKLASLSFCAESAIALLKERRAALISAAVTGKIDVRGLMNARAQAA